MEREKLVRLLKSSGWKKLGKFSGSDLSRSNQLEYFLVISLEGCRFRVVLRADFVPEETAWEGRLVIQPSSPLDYQDGAEEETYRWEEVFTALSDFSELEDLVERNITEVEDLEPWNNSVA